MPTGNEEPVWIDLQLAEEVCHELAFRLSHDADEPMPAFATADRGRLEASLNAPRSPVLGHDPYPGLEDKAAVLLYRLAKNHPFPNGNKRFATAAYLIFLALNGWWPDVSKDELVELVEGVAESDARTHREEVGRIAGFTASCLIPVEEASGSLMQLAESDDGTLSIEVGDEY